MGIDVSVFSADPRPLEEERRTVNIARFGENRLAVVSVSGGMMDLGWAHRGAGPILEPTTRLVAGTIADFSKAIASFVLSLRATLTHSERTHRWWCSVQFAALEWTDSQCRLARLGGMRVFSFGQGSREILGKEDVMSLFPGGPPIIATSCLIPDVHWKVAGGDGWVLNDETAEAEQQAAAIREEQHDKSANVSLAVITHPFWVEAGEPSVSAPSSYHDVVRTMRELVKKAQPERLNALVAVVRRR